MISGLSTSVNTVGTQQMNNQDKGYGEIRMIDSNYIEMCRALPKEVQDAIQIILI